ncbi:MULTISPECIES: glycosyltransferase family 2 protein [Ramlibacter]|uniref:Glycosyltransferase n=1 Tax=Ramlibacter pinisoli TaxID=2682844 RepID=A0A6N8IT80_9BURK|nr:MULTISPECIES: glycosyltransferase [Ramlibacter]MBA2964830.1 glycosyltransferase [Ramlibacter sp. CGMCC 1.13660]MVQ29795.1 glycosyltransferase [Ramlibacter pinisoli]
MLDRLDNVARYVARLGVRGAVSKTYGAMRRGGASELARIVRNVWTSAVPRPVPGEPGRDRNEYAEWVRRYDTVSSEDEATMRSDMASWLDAPRISIVMPTFNPDKGWLSEAIDSVLRQAYPNWELCIADDASTKPHVRQVLQEYAARDTRIRVAFRDENGHISATSNSALALATGRWLVLLDHDDILPCHALYWIAKTVVDSPRVRMIYSDEDKINELGTRFDAYFKSDWNPDLFRSQNMFSHLGAFDMQLVRQVGGFRVGLEGSQDYDLTLRCMEMVERDQVAHVPRVLYHWRVHEESTARSNSAKPYAQVAAERALNEHLERTGRRASVSATKSGYRVVFELPRPAPRVGIVVTGSASRRRRDEGLAALLATDYPDLRIYVLNHSVPATEPKVRRVSRDDDAQAYLGAIEKLRADGCTVMCLIDAAGVPSSRDWLREMVSQCLRPEIGLVGARLVDGRGRVLSAGVIHLGGRLVDMHAGVPSDSHGYGGRCQLVQQVPFVRSSCVVMRIEVYDQLVGDTEIAYADRGMQLCARAATRGLDVLWTPYAQVEFKSALAPLPAPDDGDRRPVDGAYNPNLHLGEADFSLGWPPLVTRTGTRPSRPLP